MLCPCHSGRKAKTCCLRFIQGKQNAKTPVALMRSRYTAYALGGYGEYLFKTWLPMQRKNLIIADLSLKTAAWKRLDILAHSQDGDHGVVEFNAYFVDDGLNEKVHYEKSLFQRVDALWYYVKAIN